MLPRVVEASPEALPQLDVGLMEKSTSADVANVPQAEVSWDPRADLAPHVATTADAVDYEVVIPTYGRWKPSQELAPNRARLKDWKEAFILDHTLRFLAREAVPKNRVTLFVATDAEAENYRNALQGSDWAEVQITVSAPGIRDSRNFIYKHFPAETYVVSLDDDIEGIKWKVREGNTDATCIDLPPGNFVKIIYDAYKRMKESGAYLWGLSTSQNPRALSLSVCSLRNGLINGYLHGFICRPDAASDLLRRLSDAIEDAEFSVRHFAKDGAVLRYRMYAGRTSPFSNSGGLQSKFQASNARKTEEWCGAQQLHELFPSLIGAPSEESHPAGGTATTQVKFIFGPVKRHLRTIRRLGGLGRFMVPILKAKKRKSIREMRSMLARAKAFITKGNKTSRTAAQNSSAVELAAKRKKRMEMRAETALACDRKIISTQAWDLMDEDTLRFAANTKTPGSASHRRYAKYSKARTVKQAMTLGWRTDDRRFDITHGFAKIVMLDTKPASSECLVEDEQRVIPATPAGRAVPIRLAEVVEKNPGIHLSRTLVWPLLSRCPVFDVAAKGCWAKLAAKGGLLAEVPLPIFRILLHWGNTGCLAFARAQGPALSAALRRLGAEPTALCVEQRLDRSALKFSRSSSGGVAVAATEPIRCGSTEAEGHVRGEKSGTAGNGSKKRGRGRRQAAEPPSKVNVASLLQRAVDVKAGQMDVGPQLASDGDPKSSTPGAETQQPSEEATGVTCKQGEALPSVPTPSTAAPESPTSEEDKSLPSVGGLFQGCGSGTDPCSQQPSTLPSAGGSVADVPMVKETEEVAVLLGGRVHRQRNLKSLFACKS